MDLNIKKDSRSNEFIKMPYGTSNREIRRLAILDISKDCGEGKFFTANYISRESQVLDNCKKILIVLPLDTTIY